MTACSPAVRPIGAVIADWARRIMDVILHIGAHRTGTMSFQEYMRHHTAVLAERGIGFLGLGQSEQGGLRCLDEMSQKDMLSDKELGKQLDLARATGVSILVVSDENLLGSVRRNLRDRRLYPQCAARVAHVLRSFDGPVARVVLGIRSLEQYWCSTLADAVMHGAPVPTRSDLADIAGNNRTWRDVVEDIARAAHGVDLRVLPLERYSAWPHALLKGAIDQEAPADVQRRCLKRSPTLPGLRRALHDRGQSTSSLPFGMEHWNPFTNEEHAALREMYADDIMWLTAGADGLATLTEDGRVDRAGATLPHGLQKKGRRDELEERKMARPG